MANIANQENAPCGASLTALPVELLVKVATFCAPDELRSLRQVSRLLEQTTFESWREHSRKRITIAMTEKDIDRHLRILSTSHALGNGILELRLVVPAFTSQNGIMKKITTSCIPRLADVLHWLPHISTFELQDWNEHFDARWYRDLSALPSLAAVCRLLSGYNIERIHLDHGFFFARELSELLGTLQPGCMHAWGCRVTRSPHVSSRAAQSPTSPDQRFTLAVTGSSSSPEYTSRSDLGRIYFDIMPDRNFTAIMQFASATGPQRYNVDMMNSLNWGHRVQKIWGWFNGE